MSRKNIDTRDLILNAAWHLLESSPGTGVRMSDIAKAAGVSRQAVYLHFASRAELLIATVRHIDEVKNVESRMAASRDAATATARLDAFIDGWGNYIPQIHGVARALWAMKDTDREADAAWNDRMNAVRDGCKATVAALSKEGALAQDLTPRRASDLLWTLLSVRSWEQLTIACGWSQKHYIAAMKRTARLVLLEPGNQHTNHRV